MFDEERCQQRDDATVGRGRLHELMAPDGSLHGCDPLAAMVVEIGFAEQTSRRGDLSGDRRGRGVGVERRSSDVGQATQERGKCRVGESPEWPGRGPEQRATGIEPSPGASGDRGDGNPGRDPHRRLEHRAEVEPSVPFQQADPGVDDARHDHESSIGRIEAAGGDERAWIECTCGRTGADIAVHLPTGRDERDGVATDACGHGLDNPEHGVSAHRGVRCRAPSGQDGDRRCSSNGLIGRDHPTAGDGR